MILLQPNGDTTPTWSVSGDNGDQWVSAQANIQRSVPYRIVFQATIGSGELSDIAIDDVSYIPNACQLGGKITHRHHHVGFKAVVQSVLGWPQGNHFLPYSFSLCLLF